ncbi:fasciclin domain-containing protein [Maribius pontilimi]|uniref:Fasciclin domain-containing protein n=1 Tax=Palleronia pontilimi TaxID=1964209 RepID=A0A934IF30_9RHOB|nr:fasciclin domain-containing protein [Palleronia pontilimi]MBJ3761698.1 fasciclin domain-containing protein [Palleronia pontilimi]
MLRRTLLSLTAAAAISAPVYAAEHSMNIVETAQGAEGFSTLVAAIEAAGLAETLSGEGPFTVFAPTDEAFAALPEGTLDNLLMEENKDQLTAILTYHVLPGKTMAGDITGEMNVETVNGAEVSIMTDGGVTYGGAAVVDTDIEASNGVIHVIDSVVLPPESM